MNWHRNNNNNQDKILHDTFTAYLTTAVYRRRLLYIKQQKRVQKANNCLDQLLINTRLNTAINKEDELPIMLQLESEKLYNALMHLSERERYIFLAFVLEEKNYSQLAEELNIGYKGVAAIYYRTLKKLKDSIRRDIDEI